MGNPSTDYISHAPCPPLHFLTTPHTALLSLESTALTQTVAIADRSSNSTGYITCRAHCKMKMWDPLFKWYEDFQDNESRALNQTQDLVEHRACAALSLSLSLRLSLSSNLSRGARAAGRVRGKGAGHLPLWLLHPGKP